MRKSLEFMDKSNQHACHGNYKHLMNIPFSLIQKNNKTHTDLQLFRQDNFLVTPEKSRRERWKSFMELVY